MSEIIKTKFSICLCIFMLSAGQIEAQDFSRYWTHQYGAKGLLFNGAVIASPDGETSSYYNPGAIGMDDDLGFLFSFLTPTYTDFEINEVIGDGHSLSDKGFGFAPGFFGIRFRPFKEKKITIGLSNFNRYDSNISFEDRQSSSLINHPNSVYRTDIEFSRRIKEYWFGLGMAYNPREDMGFGITQFIVRHSQNLSSSIISEIKDINDIDAISQYSLNKSEYNISMTAGFVTKLGWSYETEDFHLGATYTSPIYGTLIKSGGYLLENILVDQVNQNSFSISNRSDANNVAYRSPHSVGFGIDIHLDSTEIAFSSEYFFGIDSYSILDETNDSFDSVNGVTRETNFNVNSQNEAVLNIAIGIQRKVSKQFSCIFGFRTDFNPNARLTLNDDIDYLGVVGDVYHISGGALISKSQNQFSFGFDFGFGNRSGDTQLIDFNNISPDNFPALGGNKNTVNSQFKSFMIFMTYDFIFNRISGD